MKIVLKPYWIAEECFLHEALMWAGFSRFPLSEIIPDHVDIRFDKNSQDEYSPTIPDSNDYIESEEAIRVGLPPNPEWEHLIEDTNDLYLSANSIRDLLKAGLPNDAKKELEEKLSEAERREAKQAEWDEKYAEYTELIKSKIYIGLREGRLESLGRSIPDGDEDSSYTDFEHTPIPAHYWRLNSINWKESASQNPKGHYCHIVVKTEQLFSLFPPPDSTQAKAVQLVAGQYILDDADTNKILPRSARGRPPKDWESFYIEVMDRVKNGTLPDKQEAFISDMQEWCLRNWGSQVGRSTLLERISPIYKKFGKS